MKRLSTTPCIVLQVVTCVCRLEPLHFETRHNSTAAVIEPWQSELQPRQPKITETYTNYMQSRPLHTAGCLICQAKRCKFAEIYRMYTGCDSFPARIQSSINFGSVTDFNHADLRMIRVTKIRIRIVIYHLSQNILVIKWTSSFL